MDGSSERADGMNCTVNGVCVGVMVLSTSGDGETTYCYQQ